MSDAIVPILAILGALLVGTVSPGPSFVLVVRTSVAAGRRDGIAAAFGMGLGGAIFAGLGLLGAQAVLSQVGWLYLALKVAGGLYLLYLAIRLWRGAHDPVLWNNDGQRAIGIRRSLSLALITQLSNPKTAVFYASVFAALMPARPSPWLFVMLPPLIFTMETSWYAIVATAFSATGPRALYTKSKAALDRIAGSVMGLLGLKLIAQAGQPS